VTCVDEGPMLEILGLWKGKDMVRMSDAFAAAAIDESVYLLTRQPDGLQREFNQSVLGVGRRRRCEVQKQRLD
jgi:hypothetical protein